MRPVMARAQPMSDVPPGFEVSWPSQRARWTVGLATAGLVHLGIITAMLPAWIEKKTLPPLALPPPMALDMSSLPAAPRRPDDAPPQRAQVPPPVPQPARALALPLPPSPAPAPVAQRLQPHRRPRPLAKPQVSLPPAAPRVMVPRQAATATAAVHGLTSSPQQAARLTWETEVLSRLEQFKQYPGPARWRNEQGLVLVQITLDRTGAVTACSIIKGSGFDDLDDAALATVHRAAPLPAPPASIPGATITRTFALVFTILQP